MGDSQGYDFLFCDLCGTMLSFDSYKYAKCSLCGFKRSAKDFDGREIRYTVTAEDFRKDLNKFEESFIKMEGEMDVNIEVQKKVSGVTCTQCRKAQFEYFEKQTRSADEGMTVFYECPSCGHKENQNT